MQCPVDGTDLNMTDRQGIEIDYCPKCRGVWLDRGELDKLIERSEQAEQPSYDRGSDHRSSDYKSPKQENRGGRKKEGFLSNVFEGFGGGDD